MRYTKEQRLDIGRRIYNGELTKYEAAKQYDISHSTARDYMRMYRDENRLPLLKTYKKLLFPYRKLTFTFHFSFLPRKGLSHPLWLVQARSYSRLM